MMTSLAMAKPSPQLPYKAAALFMLTLTTCIQHMHMHMHIRTCMHMHSACVGAYALNMRRTLPRAAGQRSRPNEFSCRKRDTLPD